MSDQIGDALGDLGDVNILGMNEWGEFSAVGWTEHPLLGIGIGAVAGMVGHKVMPSAPAVGGIGAGLVAGAVAWFGLKKKPLGIIIAGTAVVLEGIKALLPKEWGLSGTVVARAYPVPSRSAPFAGNGLGITTLAPGYGVPPGPKPPLGGLGATGRLSLLGDEMGDESGFGAKAQNLRLLGGPAVSSLSGHFGSTHFGKH